MSLHQSSLASSLNLSMSSLLITSLKPNSEHLTLSEQTCHPKTAYHVCILHFAMETPSKKCSACALQMLAPPWSSSAPGFHTACLDVSLKPPRFHRTIRRHQESHNAQVARRLLTAPSSARCSLHSLQALRQNNGEPSTALRHHVRWFVHILSVRPSAQTITLRAGAQGRRLNCRWVCRHSAGRLLEPPTRLPRSRQQQVMLPPCRNCLSSVKVRQSGSDLLSLTRFLFNFRPFEFWPL